MRQAGFLGWVSFLRVIYVLPGYEHDERLLRHERKHMEKIHRYWRTVFAVKYAWWLLRYWYWNNPYEIDARAAESHPIDLSKMRQ